MTALERLESSRGRLRLAMLPPPPSASDSRPAGSSSWLQRLKGLPLVGLVVDALSGWWMQHPLRPMFSVAAQASGAVAKPLAQRHPVALVLAAGLVGAALAWARPWRWALKSALFAGLAPQLASRIASKLPIESWMTLLGTALSGAGRQAGAAAPSPHAGPDLEPEPAAA
jgi:hypothetical protein